MRKALILIFALTLILGIPVQAFAVTPSIKIPDMPGIPEVKVEVKLSDNFWSNHFNNNPIEVDYSKIKFDFDIDWSKLWR